MKAFQYSMQRLLDAKMAIEDAKRGKVGCAIRDLEREKQRLIELVAEAERAAHAGHFQKEHSSHSMEIRARYVSHVRQQATKCAHNVVICEQALAHAYSELAQATMERESLEKLRDREEQAWRLEVRRSEQKEMDETAMQQHARRRRTATAGQHLAA